MRICISNRLYSSLLKDINNSSPRFHLFFNSKIAILLWQQLIKHECALRALEETVESKLSDTLRESIIGVRCSKVFAVLMHGRRGSSMSCMGHLLTTAHSIISSISEKYCCI